MVPVSPSPNPFQFLLRKSKPFTSLITLFSCGFFLGTNKTSHLLRPTQLKFSCDWVLGFAMGGFFSLMSATFAYEDPLTRASTQMANAGTRAQTVFVFKEMGRNMWSSGKGFAKVGALYSGIECCIEGVGLFLPSSLLSRVPHQCSGERRSIDLDFA